LIPYSMDAASLHSFVYMVSEMDPSNRRDRTWKRRESKGTARLERKVVHHVWPNNKEGRLLNDSDSIWQAITPVIAPM
ncbi:hypothetical protein OFM35_34290, partial [Escherichia coli]|nr:hypothetical protein [Escherichia coli]